MYASSPTNKPEDLQLKRAGMFFGNLRRGGMAAPLSALHDAFPAKVKRDIARILRPDFVGYNKSQQKTCDFHKVLYILFTTCYHNFTDFIGNFG